MLRDSRPPRGALAAAFALASCLCAPGCQKSQPTAPELMPGESPLDPYPCAALYDAGSAVTEHLRGPLRIDGGEATCFPERLVCPLPDTDGGLCDGGPDAASPRATCVGTVWVGECHEHDAAP